MEFCVISPTSGLERYATLSKTHLVLTHEYKNLDYLRFYIAREQEGDTIILDNGSYEGKLEYNWDLIQALEPDVVVLPDYYCQPWKKTWHAAIAWLDQNFDDASGFECLYIPQAQKGDLIGFIESYHRAIEDPRITWIGIPRALAYAVTDDPLMRVKFAEQVKRDRPDLRMHAFGMVNGDVHELPYLAHAGVDSVDSSAPVWRGWNGFDLTNRDDYARWDKEGVPIAFNAIGELDREGLILENLEACGVRTTKVG